MGLFKIKMDKPKKSLGQNFLTSVGAVNKIVEVADYKRSLTILEVGPGRGVLTEALLKKFDKVLAIEKDKDLIGFLSAKFSAEIAANKLELFEGDILNLNPSNLGSKTPSKSYAIVANIPYYITGQFLRQWLSTDNHPEYMVLMLQKEVAQRIDAKDGKESLLSTSVKVYGEPKYIETVKKGSFYPIPKVNSAILKISNISKQFFRPDMYINIEENHFFSILKAGFAHKRKFLIKNLLTKFPSKEKLETIFKSCNLEPKCRAEDVQPEQWQCLAQNL
ncbi:MAG: ribosomal RNA small subunit methyltransferase A [Candidatus Vogelbacteria bacterium]|nr:ribosomal RNA small subunit methyltransferase A [Candidatus Vogelbacteria bacterium]